MAKSKKNGSGGSPSKRGGRKSKAESMTGAKENAVELRKGELDLKQIEIDDSSFDMHLKSIKSAKERFDNAKRLYDGCCNAAKKVGEEMLASVKLAMKFERMDLDDVKALLERQGYVLRRANSPIQISLHDTLIGDAKEFAYKRGLADEAKGRGNKNPYPDGSDLADRYNDGWRESLAKRMGVPVDPQESGNDIPEPGAIGHNSDHAAEARM